MKSRKTFRYLLLSLMGFALVSAPVSAQEEGGDSEEASSTQESIIQGKAAIILANSLGLAINVQGPLTQDQAIQLLMQQGISPLGGWQPNAPMTSANVARVIVQALGLDQDFTEDQVNDPESQAYKDKLVENFGLDVDELIAQGELVQTGVELTSGDNTGDNGGTTTDNPDEPEVIVDEADLVAVITATTPTQGGGGGQVGGGSSDMTPSAP